MARSARGGLSAGMSTRVTSGLAVRTRRVTGSEAATGKLAQLWTARATLVPSTRTCSTARCSLSDATITTESSGMILLGAPYCFLTLTELPELLACTMLPLFAAARRLCSIEFVLIQKRFRIRGCRRRLSAWRDATHRAQNHQLGIAFCRALALEKIAQNWNVTQSWNLVVDVGDTIVHQTRNDEALAVLQFKFSVRPPRA